MVVWAYDDTKRAADGTFEVLVKAGPLESMVKFTVLDIPVSYAILLGRPWFHPLGGVPSTLHQMIKFPAEGDVIVIRAGEGEVVASLKTERTPIMGFQVAGIYED